MKPLSSAGSVQRQPTEEEEEELQMKPLGSATSIQRQPIEEEEEERLQAKSMASHITPVIQRQLKEDEKEEEETIQAKAQGPLGEATSGLSARIHALKGGGQALPEDVRSFFEPRFGHDFSQVQVHTDTRAAETASAVNARAYTLGRDMVFGRGQYAPETSAGRRLLAHELTHVVQQSQASPQATTELIQRGILCDWPPYECGEVRFTNCDNPECGHKLTDFAVIPERNNELFTPLDNVNHEPVDGFWWRDHDDADEWLKIPDSCALEVECMKGGIRFDQCGDYKDVTVEGDAPRGLEDMPEVANPF